MKSVKCAALAAVAATAKSVTSATVNSGCLCLLHQPKLPKGAEKLRKR